MEQVILMNRNKPPERWTCKFCGSLNPDFLFVPQYPSLHLVPVLVTRCQNCTAPRPGEDAILETPPLHDDLPFVSGSPQPASQELKNIARAAAGLPPISDVSHSGSAYIGRPNPYIGGPRRSSSGSPPSGTFYLGQSYGKPVWGDTPEDIEDYWK